MKSQHPHHHHDDIARRLKRADGHLRSIIQMIDDGKPCVEIAQQLHAVEKAITQAKRTLIQDHIDHCLEHALEKPSSKKTASSDIEEFKQITKFL
ncbi:MAG: metal resistance protein [Alphaproteobacteria bacterium]|nr:metal resistance protein [Alphaproteobacteria bacterium]